MTQALTQISTLLKVRMTVIRAFSKFTGMAIAPILASEALLRENQKSSEKCYPNGNRTRASHE